jgi:flagellar protein FliS
MSISSYEENRILNASPVELVRILYNAAVRAVQNARASLRAGDILSRSREISKAQVILFELAISVDPSKGKEMAERLLALYDYMQSRLVEANAEQKDGPLAEVDNLLGTLQEAWSQCEEAELALR